jgi:hypothetical protein
MFLRFPTALAATLVLTSGVAQAAKLSTPLVGVGAGRVLQCIATNVGTSPVTISIKLYDVDGNAIVANSDSCVLAPVEPHASCSAQPLVGQVASCVVESASRNVRAAAEVFSGPNIVIVVPATAR